MTRSSNAKLLLLISLVGLPAGAAVSLVDWNLACGSYVARGKVRRNARGDYLLTVNHRTRSPAELILLGGPLEEKMIRLKSTATAEIYVPRPIRGNSRPLVFLRKFLPAGEEAGDSVTLTRREPCGLKARFTAR